MLMLLQAKERLMIMNIKISDLVNLKQSYEFI